MARIEKTVFVSYRRTDESWARAIFQDLTQHGYDVFIDYDGIASGSFETAILENIKARAHFLVLLTPTALERCGDPKDWMRREIEAALDSRRNIVPLMLEGSDFCKPPGAGQLTGKLAELKKYNGLEIPTPRFFSSEMERLRNRFLNVPVDAVLHPASDSAQQVAKKQKDKATRALGEAPRAATTTKTVAAATAVLAAGAAGVIGGGVLAAGGAGLIGGVGVLAVIGGVGALLAGSAAKRLFKVRKHHDASISVKDLVEDMHVGGDMVIAQPDDKTDALTTAWARASKAEFEELGQRAAKKPRMPAGELAAPHEYKDNVECSIFAPARPERGRTILVQALLHEAEQLATAAMMATEIDPSTNRKGFCKLSTRIKPGELVQLFLEIPFLAVEKAFQEVNWLGEPIRVAYAVYVPVTARLGPCQGTLHVWIKGVPVGEVVLELNVEEQKVEPNAFGIAALGPVDPDREDKDQRLDPVAIDALSFRKAFMSYSRKDVKKVYLYAEALEDCGIEPLVDVNSIEPGEEWECKLVDLINAADVFYLMWSKNAAKSKWVDKESRVAIARYDNDSKGVPRIRPVVIEQPSPEPPAYLRRFHFNSKWLALRAANTTSRRLFARVRTRSS